MNSHLATAIRTTVILVVTWAIAWAVVPAGTLSTLGRKTGFSSSSPELRQDCHGCVTFVRCSWVKLPRVAPIDKLSVVFAIVLAAFFLRERLTAQQAIGASLIVAGAWSWPGKPADSSPPMKFKSNNCVAVHVKDLGEAETFYTDVMGFELKTRTRKYLEFDTGHFLFYVNKGPKTLPPIPSFGVKNVGKAKRLLAKSGCKVTVDAGIPSISRIPSGSPSMWSSARELLRETTCYGVSRKIRNTDVLRGRFGR